MTAQPVGRGDSIELGLESMSVDEGISLIKSERVEPLLEYLRGGPFRNNTNLTFMKAYSVVVQFGDQPQHSLKLYNFYKEVVQGYCRELIAGLTGVTGSDFISKLARFWEKLTILIYWLQRVFQYLDRFFTQKADSDLSIVEKPQLFTAAVQIFSAEVYTKLCDKMVVEVIAEINRERDGLMVDVDALRLVIEAFCIVDNRQPKVEKSKDGTERLMWSGGCGACYKTDFESSLLKATKDYLARWVAERMSHNSCPEVLREIERRLAQEEGLLNRYFDSSSKLPLQQVCHEVLILETAKTLVDMDSGCKHMFENGKTEELRCMFRLFRREPKMLEHMTAVMEPFIEERCRKIVDDPSNIDDTQKFVQLVLALKRELDDMVQKCFDSEVVFQKSRNKALEQVLNKDTRCARYLALYCDLELKRSKGAAGSSGQDDAMKVFVEEVVGLFAHLKDKDIFLDVYKKALAKRLLKRISVSDFAEEEFLSHLKVEVGQQAIQKLQCMFTDMRLSDALQAEYAGQSHGSRLAGVVHDTRVLQVNAWPEKADEVNIVACDEMRACTTAFEQFYNSKHTGRKLRWSYSEGTCEVAASCYKRKHVFVVSPYQCIVLVLFNKHAELTFRQVLDMTKIPEDECRRQIASISIPPKQRLLRIGGDGKKLEEGSVLSINPDLQNEKTRVVISLIKEKEKPVVVETEVPEAASERKHVVDAAIVRVMKARKRLAHNLLLEEVVQQCKLFCPQPQQIKMQIQHLIDRDFLQRAADNNSIYEYRP